MLARKSWYHVIWWAKLYFVSWKQDEFQNFHAVQNKYIKIHSGNGVVYVNVKKILHPKFTQSRKLQQLRYLLCGLILLVTWLELCRLICCLDSFGLLLPAASPCCYLLLPAILSSQWQFFPFAFGFTLVCWGKMPSVRGLGMSGWGLQVKQQEEQCHTSSSCCDFVQIASNLLTMNLCCMTCGVFQVSAHF